MEKTLPEQFTEWLRQQHLKDCAQCQKEGKARLMDNMLMASGLFKLFYYEQVETERKKG